MLRGTRKIIGWTIASVSTAFFLVFIYIGYSGSKAHYGEIVYNELSQKYLSDIYFDVSTSVVGGEVKNTVSLADELFIDPKFEFLIQNNQDFLNTLKELFFDIENKNYDNIKNNIYKPSLYNYLEKNPEFTKIQSLVDEIALSHRKIEDILSELKVYDSKKEQLILDYNNNLTKLSQLFAENSSVLKLATSIEEMTFYKSGILENFPQIASIKDGQKDIESIVRSVRSKNLNISGISSEIELMKEKVSINYNDVQSFILILSNNKLDEMRFQLALKSSELKKKLLYLSFKEAYTKLLSDGELSLSLWKKILQKYEEQKKSGKL